MEKNLLMLVKASIVFALKYPCKNTETRPRLAQSSDSVCCRCCHNYNSQVCREQHHSPAFNRRIKCLSGMTNIAFQFVRLTQDLLLRCKPNQQALKCLVT